MWKEKEKTLMGRYALVLEFGACAFSLSLRLPPEFKIASPSSNQREVTSLLMSTSSRMPTEAPLECEHTTHKADRVVQQSCQATSNGRGSVSSMAMSSSPLVRRLVLMMGWSALRVLGFHTLGVIPVRFPPRPWWA